MVLGNVTCGRDLDGGSECASECASEFAEDAWSVALAGIWVIRRSVIRIDAAGPRQMMRRWWDGSAIGFIATYLLRLRAYPHFVLTGLPNAARPRPRG